MGGCFRKFKFSDFFNILQHVFSLNTLLLYWKKYLQKAIKKIWARNSIQSSKKLVTSLLFENSKERFWMDGYEIVEK